MGKYTDIRSAFQEWAESWPDLSDEEDPLGVDISRDDEPTLTLGEALEALAGSDDVMPWPACEGLGLPHGSSYGDAVADLRSGIAAGTDRPLTLEEAKILYNVQDADGIPDDLA